MTIKIGDRLPDATFTVMTADGPAPKTTNDIFSGRKVVLFAVPGAFTPTCHRNHMPGFVNNADAIKAKGVDAIAVTAVNDVFVMNAWAEACGGKGSIEFLADGSGAFAKALGLSMDLSERGLGLRSKRYAMVVEDGAVTHLGLDETPGKVESASAEQVLSALG
ncbi:peroxiredoxin [Agaricicola taiwanensis]|uniref:Glutathione-dependent peroxiredoxin n=1 Tax=Agaricicola taiwanensis TaxID=591372 RepID=A0A8J2YGA5_9RHOB|nr:peroxiredoxin [Agaricicola taiwanensis]GGE34712.1 peroxiredoxin [Agaricicola taiwanensis]